MTKERKYGSDPSLSLCHRDLDKLIYLGIPVHPCSCCAGIWAPTGELDKIVGVARGEAKCPDAESLAEAGGVSVYETRVESRAQSEANPPQPPNRWGRWSRLFDLVEGQ